MIGIEEQTKAVTSDEALELWLGMLETISVNARAWPAAGKMRTFMRIFATTYAALTAVMAAFINSGYLDRAEGVWLHRLAIYVYGVTPIAATFARGTLTITNTGGGIYAFGPREVTVRTADGRFFVNVAALNIGANTTITATFEALEAGSKGSAAAGTVNAFETTISSRVTCTNVASFVGSDEETPEDLRQRCRDRLAARSPNGPRGAYAYAVRSAKRNDGAAVDVNRVAISPQSDTGEVTIHVASPSGVPLPDDLTAIRDQVDREARTDTDKVTVSGAAQVFVTRTFTAWARRTPGLTEEAVRVPAEQALIALERDYPIGGIAKTAGGQGYLYGDAMKAAVARAHASIFDVDASSDADVALATGQIVRIAFAVDVRFV